MVTQEKTCMEGCGDEECSGGTAVTQGQIGETEQLHQHCDCEATMEDETPALCKEPRPPDDDLSSDSDNGDTEMQNDPIALLLQGQPIVPKFAPRFYDINELARAGSSLQNVPLAPNHQELIWTGSSLGTMHKVPLPAKQLVRTGSRISVLQRAPSIISKSKLSSCRFGSQTVSECGTDIFSVCKICQMTGDETDPLISPCRCAGSLKYIHSSCLKKWIRYSQRRGKKHPPRCELCHYQFQRHKRFKFSQWRWPRVRPRDKCLHVIFLLNLLIMVGCAIATVMCFLSDRGTAAKFPKNKVKLTSEEVITLTCGVTFFVAFFIAMTVEIKARHTLYRLFMRFIMHNTEWTVEQYDPTRDTQLKRIPTSQV